VGCERRLVGRHASSLETTAAPEICQVLRRNYPLCLFR
jgi:hypothetical protein